MYSQNELNVIALFRAKPFCEVNVSVSVCRSPCEYVVSHPHQDEKMPWTSVISSFRVQTWEIYGCHMKHFPRDSSHWTESTYNDNNVKYVCLYVWNVDMGDSIIVVVVGIYYRSWILKHILALMCKKRNRIWTHKQAKLREISLVAFYSSASSATVVRRAAIWLSVISVINSPRKKIERSTKETFSL